MIFINKNKKGFTLMEIMVSVLIISMLITIFLVNYVDTNKRTELILVAQKLATDLRLVQNNTLGSVEYDTQIPKGGWGIHFDLTSNDRQYIIFADLNENLVYDDGSAPAPNDVNEAVISSGGRIINLPKETKIAGASIGNVVDITFLPPDPITNIYNGTATSTSVTITLQEERESSIKEIAVNYFGLIEVSK